MRKFIVDVKKDDVTMAEICRILAAHLCTSVGVTEVEDFNYKNWCKNISECTEDEVNCAECGSVAKNVTTTKQIELVEE